MAQGQLDRINDSSRFTKCWKLLTSGRNNTAFKHDYFPIIFSFFPFSICFSHFFLFLLFCLCLFFFFAIGNLDSLLILMHDDPLNGTKSLFIVFFCLFVCFFAIGNLNSLMILMHDDSLNGTKSLFITVQSLIYAYSVAPKGRLL